MVADYRMRAGRDAYAAARSVAAPARWLKRNLATQHCVQRSDGEHGRRARTCASEVSTSGAMAVSSATVDAGRAP